MRGVTKRTAAQTRALIELAGGCEDCGATENLEVHRIVPGYKGGTYLPRNCRILCQKCHDRYDEGW